MSGQAPRRLQRGRWAALDNSASGKRRERPYQCTLHVHGGRGKYEKRPTMHSMFASTSQSNDDGLRASYNISLLIAKSGKPHTIGEQLILPAVEEVECIDEDIHTYSQHLSALHDDSKTRFEDILTMDIPPWIINPFDETEVANVVLQEELLELSTNEELKARLPPGYRRGRVCCVIRRSLQADWPLMEPTLRDERARRCQNDIARFNKSDVYENQRRFRAPFSFTVSSSDDKQRLYAKVSSLCTFKVEEEFHCVSETSAAATVFLVHGHRAMISSARTLSLKAPAVLRRRFPLCR
ncbi:hypothetical protein EVAR_24307_1 [Eumeta japonica]|uniref:Uncharacterized protein n=1 Tax=Eumeta variegata TaxID=151549 RepID=A0A4C1VLX5_EUMVA|nr:hypothetical protein EVAR_24307_1 [Eumeta japonica]